MTRKYHSLSAGLVGACAAAAVGAAAGAQTIRAPMAVPFDAAPLGPAIVWNDSYHEAVDGTGPGMLAAADHIIGFQCGDGGWGWPHTACPTTTFANLTGAIGSGLLRVYDVTGDADVLASIIAGGDFDLLSVYPNLTPAFGSFSPGFLHKVTMATSDSTYSDHAAIGFFDALTAGTYGDPSVSSFFPADTYDYLDRHKAARSGSLINIRPWDMQMMPWVATLIGNTDSTTPADGISQYETFRDDAILDGLNTLEEGLQFDLLGLAGGLRALALTGDTSFTALTSPLFDDLVGISDLCDLADVLAGFQNADGSWSWRSDLQDPVDEADKDTQTTAYAVLALIAADEAGCIPVPGGRYNSEVAAGQAWLDSMQDGTGGFASYPTGPHNIEAEAEAAWAATIDAVSLSTSACENSGTVTVTIDMASMPDVIVGGQFFMDYDNATLDFVSADPGGAFFTEEVFESVDEGAGTIAYAVGVVGAGPGTSSASTMATLTFDTLSEVCTATADLVTFDRTHSPPTRLTNDVGDEFLPVLADLNATTIDETDPVVTPPSDITVNADAGGCDAAVTVPALDASDACTGIASITNDFNATSDASDTYPSGTTTVTWTVTDNCGNTSTAMQDITVNAVNDVDVAVELKDVFAAGPITRCITFEFYDCPDAAPAAVVEADLDFAAGVALDTIPVPCGAYTCVVARDSLHTLRKTDEAVVDGGDFEISGTVYVADFTAAGTTDDSLVGGNLNDDGVNDILDFGIFVGQYGTTPGADTPCPPAGPHADINGDGTVFTADFTFISLNFLEFDEDACCTVSAWGGPGVPGVHAARPPVTRISVAELERRGLEDLIVADLNHDGWLDVRDMEAFAGGARP